MRECTEDEKKENKVCALCVNELWEICSMYKDEYEGQIPSIFNYTCSDFCNEEVE